MKKVCLVMNKKGADQTEQMCWLDCTLLLTHATKAVVFIFLIDLCPAEEKTQAPRL